jgi:glycogen operon protein
MGRTQRGNNNAYAQDNEITWVDWERADGSLVDYVAALNKLRKAHSALTADRFLTGQERNGVRDVVWHHPEGREMTEGDWSDPGGSVLGMQLHIGGDEVLVWFNRRAEDVEARLPPHGKGWSVSLVSDDRAEAPIEPDGSAVKLPPRSVVVLVPAAD